VTPLLHEPIGTFEDTRASFQHKLREDPPPTEAGPTVAAPLPPGTITKTRITTTTVTTTAVTTPDGKTTLNTSSTRNTTNLTGRAEGPATPDINEFTLFAPTQVSVIRPCGVFPGAFQANSTPSPDQETAAEAPTQARASPSPFPLKQATNDTQAIDDLLAPAIAKADSAAPESVEQATDYLTPKSAPGKSRAAEDSTPSFEHRIVELREYYDEYGDLRVPNGYTGGSSKDLGLWVKYIRRVYTKCLKNNSRLGEESPGVVLGTNILSKLRIERLDAIGFIWSALQRKGSVISDAAPSFKDRIVELQEYYDVHGHVGVPIAYTGGRTKKLGLWVKAIRRAYQVCLQETSCLGMESPWILLGPHTLSKLRIELLEAMGFEWSAKQRKGGPSFEDRIAELREYYDEHGHLDILHACTGGRSKDFGVWVKRIREIYHRCQKTPTLLGVERPRVVFGERKLTQSRIERMEAMGFAWSSSFPKVSWEKRFQEVVAFKVIVVPARYRNNSIMSSHTLICAFD
jgi:hypothetical protein